MILVFYRDIENGAIRYVHEAVGMSREEVEQKVRQYNSVQTVAYSKGNYDDKNENIRAETTYDGLRCVAFMEEVEAGSLVEYLWLHREKGKFER